MTYPNLGVVPDWIAEKVKFAPVEDLALAVLKEAFPKMNINTLIELNQAGDDYSDGFFVRIRRILGAGLWAGDDRFIDYGALAVHVFTKDPDGDLRGALVSEAIRVALFEANLARKFYPGLGSLTDVRVDEEPSRKTDWATASGPVQFADLPAGYWRYETRYSMWVRKPIR
jgi:hypothetical protein